MGPGGGASNKWVVARSGRDPIPPTPPVSLIFLSLRLFPRPSQTPGWTHTAYPGGDGPHTLPLPLPVVPYTAPPSSHGQPHHPPISHPNPNWTYSFYHWAPGPPLQGTSNPPTPCHLFDDSHTPILPVCPQPTPCWAPSGHMHSYTLRVMHLPDLPWQRHTLFRTDVPPPKLLPSVRTRTRAHTASLPLEAPLPAWPAPPTSPDGPPSLPSQAGGLAPSTPPFINIHRPSQRGQLAALEHKCARTPCAAQLKGKGQGRTSWLLERALRPRSPRDTSSTLNPEHCGQQTP